MSFIDSGSSNAGSALGGADSAGLTALSNPANTTGGISSLLSSNPNLLTSLGLGAGVAGIGLLESNQSLPFQPQQTAAAGHLQTDANAAGGEAASLFTTGNSLINPLETGQLPQGAQAEVQQYLAKQTADVKARYASLGQTGSTMETDAVNNVQQAGQALTFQIAQQMANTGLQATSQSLQGLNISTTANADVANIYQNLMKAQISQNQSILSSIASFAGAFGSAAAKAAPALLAA